MFHVLPFMSRLLSRAWLNPGQWPDPPLAACLILSHTELVGKQTKKYSNWKPQLWEFGELSFVRSQLLFEVHWSIWFAYQVSEVNWVDGGFSNHTALVFTIRGRESQQCVLEFVMTCYETIVVLQFAIGRRFQEFQKNWDCSSGFLRIDQFGKIFWEDLLHLKAVYSWNETSVGCEEKMCWLSASSKPS